MAPRIHAAVLRLLGHRDTARSTRRWAVDVSLRASLAAANTTISSAFAAAHLPYTLRVRNQYGVRDARLAPNPGPSLRQRHSSAVPTSVKRRRHLNVCKASVSKAIDHSTFTSAESFASRSAASHWSTSTMCSRFGSVGMTLLLQSPLMLALVHCLLGDTIKRLVETMSVRPTGSHCADRLPHSKFVPDKTAGLSTAAMVTFVVVTGTLYSVERYCSARLVVAAGFSCSHLRRHLERRNVPALPPYAYGGDVCIVMGGLIWVSAFGFLSLPRACLSTRKTFKTSRGSCDRCG